MKFIAENVLEGALAESVAGTLISDEIELNLQTKQACKIVRAQFQFDNSTAGDKTIELSESTLTAMKNINDEGLLAIYQSTSTNPELVNMTSEQTTPSKQLGLCFNSLFKELHLTVQGPGTTVLTVYYRIVVEIYNLTDSEYVAAFI
jgi:hypothetical protein